MITTFKIYESEIIKKIEVGDYIKFKSISGFYKTIVGNLIFEVIGEYMEDGNRFLEIKSVLEKYRLEDVSSYTVRHLTDEERTELELKIDTKKYNL